MHGLRRATPLVTIAAALTGASCAFPTDKSDQVTVRLTAPSGIVLRGQDVSVYAEAFRVSGADTQPITNVQFAFTTGSSSTAIIQNDGGGYATVTGVNSGTVDITARAVPFEHAQQADLVLRVANPLEIAYSSQMNHGSEAVVGNSEDRGVVAGDRPEDRVESQEIDRLAADLHEVSAAPKHAQPSPLHLSKILGDKPAVDLRIDKTIFCAVAAEERSSPKR